MVFSSPANAGAKSPSGNAGGADKRCSKVDPKHPAPDCPTGTAGGAMGAVDASSLAEQLLSQVAKTAGTKIGGQIAGWALDSIFGPSPDPTQELKDQIDVLQGQMTNLQTEVNRLDDKLDASIKKLMTQADQNAYDSVAAQVNSDAAQLLDYQVQLDSWLRQNARDSGGRIAERRAADHAQHLGRDHPAPRPGHDRRAGLPRA